MYRKPLQTPKITFTISIKLQPVASLMKLKMKILNPEKLLYVQQAQEFYHEPIGNENSVFALIASGDINQLLESKLKYDADIESGKGQLSDDPLRNQIYHLVVCAAVVARTCIAAGMSEETAYTSGLLVYIRRADIQTSIEQAESLITKW